MKKKIEKVIYSDQRRTNFTWSDIKHLELEDDDVINIGWEEPYYSENNSHDGYYYASITRMVEETDEQYQKRISEETKEKERRRKFRYENYLKLKAEFENEAK